MLFVFYVIVVQMRIIFIIMDSRKRNIIRNIVSLAAGLTFGVYFATNLPDIYYYKLKDQIPIIQT